MSVHDTTGTTTIIYSFMLLLILHYTALHHQR